MTYKKHLLLATLCAIAAFLVLVLRVMHPHHRQLALIIYGIGWIPFILSIRKAIQAFPDQVKKLRAWKMHLLWAIGFLVCLWIFVVLIPVDDMSLLGMDLQQLKENLRHDLQHLEFVDTKMSDAVREVDNSPLITTSQLTAQETGELRALWRQLVEISFELDLFKRRYRAFYQVNGFVHQKEHAHAFLIAYGAHVAQYRGMALATAKIGKSETVRRILDDADSESNLLQGSFARMQGMISRPDEILRLNAGRAYLQIMKLRLDQDDPTVVRIESLLGDLDQLILKDAFVFVKNPLDVLEHEAGEAWFPIQKGVALGMASVRTVSRDYFISKADLDAAAEQLLPGDILLTRREWHMTNLGIPGYWTHAALYLSPLKTMNAYFADLPELEGKMPAAIIQERFPQVYQELTAINEDGSQAAVIEALRPGVIVQSLYASAQADSLAVLRPKVSKEDRWQAILCALPHHGKPYNYQFDFRTDTALVCSQLVCKAYDDVEGVTLEPKMSNGRLLLSPNEIARKLDGESTSDVSQLDLALFLDGMAVGKTIKQGLKEFQNSWSRPKWHIIFKDDEE